MEIWKTIQDFPDYEISNLGRVKSHKRKQEVILSPAEYSNGYLFVLLYHKGIKKGCLIHRLVLENFNPVPNMKNLQVNHLDCNRKNNELSNLEWSTSAENREYRDKLKHTPKAETILVQFLDEREDMVFDSITSCANYFGVTRKAISHYLEAQTVRSDRKIQAKFILLGNTYQLNS